MLLAWVERRNGAVWAAFVAEAAAQMREPASHAFLSEHAARAWVETEAHALGVPVQWIGPPR